MNGYKKNAMSGAYADVGAGAKPPVAGIGFFVWRAKSEQREIPLFGGGQAGVSFESTSRKWPRKRAERPQVL